jgi:hypothetical protein
VFRYADLDRAASVAGSAWSPPAHWGAPLVVTEPDAAGSRVNGVRVRWASLRPSDRRRLVAPGGGTCLLAARGDGGPFTAWDSVFSRASDRIRHRGKFTKAQVAHMSEGSVSSASASSGTARGEPSSGTSAPSSTTGLSGREATIRALTPRTSQFHAGNLRAAAVSPLAGPVR